jgi:putative transferase (TIGR04331 family)
MLLNTVGRANHDLYTSDFDQQKWIKTSIKIIQSLRPDIKKNTILRLRSDYFNEYFGIKYVDFFKNLGVTVESGEKDVNKLFSQSRLSLFDYDSTGVSENYIYNIPTLFIVPRDYLNCLTSEGERKYQMLLDNSLMFVDEKKLIEHINNHWSNITEWWMSEKNQKIIKEFNKDFNVKPDKHSMKKLKQLLSKTS